VCCVVSPALEHYVHLLNDVSTANYEKAVTCDTAKCLFSLIDLQSIETSASLDTVVLTAAKHFVSAAADEEETILKFVNFSLATVFCCCF